MNLRFIGLRLRLTDLVFDRLYHKVVLRRDPDFVIGAQAAGGPYMERWWLLPRNPIFNVYLHKILRDDDDRALHTHPWFWCSFLLQGGYIEHTIQAGGIHRRLFRVAGSIIFRGPWRAHRVELRKDVVIWPGKPPFSYPPCWTLFITGPKLKEWHFACPDRGWVHWKDFTAARNGKPGELGAGCDG